VRIGPQAEHSTVGEQIPHLLGIRLAGLNTKSGPDEHVVITKCNLHLTRRVIAAGLIKPNFASTVASPSAGWRSHMPHLNRHIGKRVNAQPCATNEKESNR
jgi:hypothetical protein